MLCKGDGCEHRTLTLQCQRQELEQGLFVYVADKISISYHYQAWKALKDFRCKALCFPKTSRKELVLSSQAAKAPELSVQEKIRCEIVHLEILRNIISPLQRHMLIQRSKSS